MPIDIESAAGGAGGGIMGALLAFFGIKQRVDRVDKDIDVMRDGVVWRNTCDKTHDAVNHRLQSIDYKLDKIFDKLTSAEVCPNFQKRKQ